MKSMSEKSPDSGQAGAITTRQIKAAEKIYRGFENYHGFDEFGGASNYSVRKLIIAIVRAVGLPRQSDSTEEIIDLDRTLMKIERPVADFFGR